MSLARFKIIVACDANNGISKRGEIPWKCSSDVKFFKEQTTGKGKNVVIMGRKTFQSLPEDFRPLPSRLNIVISRLWSQADHPEVKVFKSITDALKFVASYEEFEETYIIGGEQIYRETVKQLLYLCDDIYVTKMKTNYECDQFFPWDSVKNMKQVRDPIANRDWVRYRFEPSDSHPELEYLRALKLVLDEGETRDSRNGITKSVFGRVNMVFDISERCPILTHKVVDARKSVQELLWMIQGRTDSKWLEDRGNCFWKYNSDRKFFDARGLNRYEEGDVGPMYGFQFRHWGAEYRGCHANYAGEGVDQIQKLLEGLAGDPFGRRHILTAYNVSDLDKMVIQPCHVMSEFYVSTNRQHLDCMMIMRSSDMCLGVPYNISFYGILTYVLAKLLGMRPRRLTINCGDAHIYESHIPNARKVLKRTPLPWCKLRLIGMDGTPATSDGIDTLTEDNFLFEDYQSHEVVKFEFVA